MNFKFLSKKRKKPKRVVILGSSGIIAKNLCIKLKINKINFKVIGSKNVDLRKSEKASKAISKIINNKDVIIFLAAEAPVKNIKTLLNNIDIINSILLGVDKKKISNLIYISSDAVYTDSKKKLSENSLTHPNNYHGMMHIIREKLLENKFVNKLAILRPTMIYGKYDTHDGYGPNQFLRLALANKDIRLFGKGEEKRDHVFIDNIIDILFESILRKGIGKLNLASGKVESFKNLAVETIANTKSKSKIKFLPRKGPMPHNGYRPFDVKLINRKFKNIVLYNYSSGLKKYIKDLIK